MQNLEILLIGGGGREHALARALCRSPKVRRVHVAPGNGGTDGDLEGRVVNAPLAADDLDGLLAFARARAIDLTVVGPEAPLVAGVVDRWTEVGLRCFGPTAAAARLEGSKAFAKDFMRRHGIPTAESGTFTTVGPAEAWIDAAPFPVVVKASGLAAGKGVLLPETKDAAKVAVRAMLEGGAFGGAGAEVVVEERLVGEEVSLLALCDGETAVCLPPARDHKRIGDGDTGPNTGGMGAFAPTPALDPETRARVERDVIQRTVDGMRADGSPFSGVLYAGLMLTADGPKVLEYNCRFGDPEAQVLLPLLESDPLEALQACVDGRLSATRLTISTDCAATVVLASAGYPGKYAKGVTIEGIPQAEATGHTTVFHAGTRRTTGGWQTHGGRVLAVTGRGPDLDAALKRAYAGVEQIRFEGAQYRRDIGRVTGGGR